jgi:hypothetical protein
MALIDDALSVRITPMGSLATSKSTANTKEKQNQNTSAKVDPWGPQENYLKDIFGKAEGIYDSQAGKTFDGEMLAPFNPNQLNMFQNMVNYANTSPIAGALANQGNNLASLGQGGVAGGMEGLTDFRPTGSTMGTIADAGLYADNPYISGMVDAATRDARRATYEGQLPANARAAAASGNANSSKRFIGDAIAERGLADRVADVSAGLRGDAWSKGLDLSQGMTQFNDNAMLDRAKSMASTGLGASELGMSGLNNSVDAMKNLFGLGNEGAAGQQAASQQTLDNELQKYAFNKDDPWGSLQNYFNIIGANNWGSESKGTMKGTGTSNTTGTQTASPAAVAGGLLGGAGGFYSNIWGNKS